MVKKFISLIMTLLIVGSLAGCGKDKVKTALKAEDDAANAIVGLTDIVKTAETGGFMTAEQVESLKGPLQDIVKANDEALEVARQLMVGKVQPDARHRLQDALQLAGDAIKRLNEAGVLHIKNPNVKATFTAFIDTLKVAIETIGLQLDSLEDK